MLPLGDSAGAILQGVGDGNDQRTQRFAEISFYWYLLVQQLSGLLLEWTLF